MNTCLFLTFRYPGELSATEMGKLNGLLHATPALAKALIHTASSASDPYVKDPSPQLVLQLYFAELPALEAAAARTGPLAGLHAPDQFPVLAQAEIVQQAMLARHFAVPDPKLRNAKGEPHSTYLVSYEGEAEDLHAWHSHYLESHPKLMATFPGIREIEIYTRLDWVSGLPWPRVNFMQRNKVAFDSAAALTHALNSPVRHEMRADFNAFPRFTGPNKHFAMATHVLLPH
jgi:hypothetical protein